MLAPLSSRAAVGGVRHAFRVWKGLLTCVQSANGRSAGICDRGFNGEEDRAGKDQGQSAKRQPKVEMHKGD